MPINLARVGISETDADYLTINDDLQGNIVKSHGRHFTGQLLVRFQPGKQAAVKTFLKSLATSGRITSARQQKADAVLNKNANTEKFFRGVYLTATGYDYLGIPKASQPGDPNFQGGMKASQAALHDPAITSWESGYQAAGHAGDALFLFAHGQEAKLRAKLIEFAAVLRKDGMMRVLATEYGKGITNDVNDPLEHFGYVDGISQPVFFTQDAPTAHNRWNPLAPLDLVLKPDPQGVPGKSFGSYYVFRKLEQNVRGFKEMEMKLADALQLGSEPGLTTQQRNDKRERAGAMIVGRFENGMPVTMSDSADSVTLHDNEIGKINDFNYSELVGGKDDLSGGRCPFLGHIRKSNPRGTGGAEPLNNERKHQMARRGITYGERLIEPKDEPTFDEMPTEGVGLLFASFQQSIGDQFEFIQQNWVDNTSFPFRNPAVVTGIDAVIGQQTTSAPATHDFQKVYNEISAANQVTFTGFSGFVTLKGGEYFFAPSLTFFKQL